MAQPVDAKVYYGYLFESDKKPSKVMTALLTGIAKYIIKNIGDKETKCLTPAKLAAFYKAVGGNYDCKSTHSPFRRFQLTDPSQPALFVELPNPQISFIYQSIGCQHTLQPTSSDFDPPSIPALTLRGFVRWQSIETLLDPAEHVPFLQRAALHFPILHPETGDRFPADLPASALPTVPDAAIEEWHNACAEKLRSDCAADVKPRARASTTTNPDPRYAYAYAYTHVRAPPSYPAPSPRERPREPDYFSARPAPLRRQKTTGGIARSRSGDPLPRRSSAVPEDYESRGRRRSLPKNYYSRPAEHPMRPSSHPPHSPRSRVRQPSAEYARRHSHPRHRREGSATSSSSSSSSGAESAISETPTSPLYSTRRGSKAQGAEREAAPAGERKVPVGARYEGPGEEAMLGKGQRGRGFSVPEFRANRPQVTTYKIAVEAEKGAKRGPLHLHHSSSSGSRSRGSGGGGSVRWQDLIDLPWRRRSEGKEREERGGVEKEKYRREEFVAGRGSEERVSRERERERERRESEEERRRERRWKAAVEERR